MVHEIKGWHSRGYLPHFDGGAIMQFITISLADAFPSKMFSAWREEIELLPPDQQGIARLRRIEAYLDTGAGEAWLRDARIAVLVQDALLFFDNQRYHLHAWVVMPNHAHVLITLLEGFSLSRVIKSWKDFTVRRANQLLQRSGQFWQEDYFDRYIRDEHHYADTLAYIEYNPVKARLCDRAEDWPWSSAGARATRPAHGCANLQVRAEGELLALLTSVNDRATFLAFVRALVDDRTGAARLEKAGPDSIGKSHTDWENMTIECYLEAALAWVEDSGTLAVPGWQEFARFLYAGKIYE